MLSLSHISQGSMWSLLLVCSTLYSFPVPLSYPEHFFPSSRLLHLTSFLFPSSLHCDALCTALTVLCLCIVLKFTDHLCMTIIYNGITLILFWNVEEVTKISASLVRFLKMMTWLSISWFCGSYRIPFYFAVWLDNYNSTEVSRFLWELL